jgi:dihydroxyacetone kinase-like protein
VPGTFTGADLVAVLVRAERLLVRHRTLLDRLDAELGDGDHGENMSVGFGDAVRAVRPEDAVGDVGDLMRRLGHLLVAGVGGAGGSLYGTAFIEAGITVAGLTALSPEDSARAFNAAAEGLARRGRCRLGDKTIYDALRPAADAFAAAVAAGGGQDVAALEAARAARAGMRATLPLVARRGLALRLGERSRGHQDPGATSCYLLVRSLLAAGGQA